MQKQTIAVAMSGGVDSSAAAVLLQQQGHDIFGVTMLHYDSLNNCAEAAVNDAADVCRHLGIPHHIIEIKTDFHDIIIENFIQEYLHGRTPNPCVRCNPMIKWGIVLERALGLGAEAFATGHYVRLYFDEKRQRSILARSHFREKDQSYALWRLKQAQLARTRFPLEGHDKQAVRALAAKAGLEIATKADSQDVCFIPDDDYKRFILETLETRGERIEPGDILDKHGNVLGRHKGYPFYTIGQRKGLGIALGRPVFVTRIDPATNRIWVGDKEELYAPGLVAVDTNWIAVPAPQEGMPVTVHIRYNDAGHPATLSNIEENSVIVEFEQPRKSITPGQSAVFYDGEELVGGGIIKEALQKEDPARINEPG